MKQDELPDNCKKSANKRPRKYYDEEIKRSKDNYICWKIGKDKNINVQNVTNKLRIVIDIFIISYIVQKYNTIQNYKIWV